MPALCCEYGSMVAMISVLVNMRVRFLERYFCAGGSGRTRLARPVHRCHSAQLIGYKPPAADTVMTNNRYLIEGLTLKVVK